MGCASMSSTQLCLFSLYRRALNSRRASFNEVLNYLLIDVRREFREVEKHEKWFSDLSCILNDTVPHTHERLYDLALRYVCY